MDDGNDFLVTLPSNSNMRSHPDNEPANYTVKLANPISLQGDWEAALVSVQYTHNWVISDDNLFLRFILLERDPTTAARSQPGNEYSDFIVLDHTARIRTAATILARHDRNKAGLSEQNVDYKDAYIFRHHYSTPQELGDEVCKAFHIAFPNTRAKLYYLFDHSIRSGRFVANNAEIAILSTDQRLGDLLGHTSKLVSCGVCDTQGKTLLESEEIEEILNRDSRTRVRNVDGRHWYLMDRLGRNTPKMKTVTSLWVYSDITKRQRVGDAQVPLLGIVPVLRAPAGVRTHYCVNPVQFLGLARTYIDTITISLATERGERVPFAKNAGDDTNVVCCIRFRRCKPSMPI
jgi:hypothetical protein